MQSELVVMKPFGLGMEQNKKTKKKTRVKEWILHSVSAISREDKRVRM